MTVWEKPELTVLVRNRLEEAVLATCKGNGTTTSNQSLFDACQRSSTACNQVCSAIATS
jgi:hypothetical protein